MERVKTFLKRKNIQISARRYGIDALGAMAQGLFCSLLIGTILDTLGAQLGIEALVTIGGYASAMSGPAMAIAIGYALQAPPLVLFSLATVGYAANALGATTLDGGKGAGGPLAVLFIAIIAAEIGKAVSKETKIDILVTPLATILAGVGLSAWWAPAIGTAATSVGSIIMWATDLQPFLMGIVVSVVIGIALTLPISSASICAALGLTGLAGGAAVAGCCANMIGFAVMSFRIFLLLCPLTGFQTVAAIYLQAIGNPAKSALLSLSRQIIFFVPAAVILPVFMGVKGVLWTRPVADGLAFVLSLALIVYERKQLKKVPLSE